VREEGGVESYDPEKKYRKPTFRGKRADVTTKRSSNKKGITTLLRVKVPRKKTDGTRGEDADLAARLAQTESPGLLTP